MLQFVRLVGQGGEGRLEPVVDGGGRERPGEDPSEAWREDLRRAEARRDPGADAARAGDELPDRLPHVPGLDGLLVAAVRVALDERLPKEARQLVAADRARRL